MTHSVRVGVVGCGLIGRRRALEANSHPASTCVAVADPDAQARRALADAARAEATSEWEQLVDRSDIDVVVVSTPTGFLADISIAALESGKHVLVEKPMGRSLSEALRMQAAADAAGLYLKVGFNHRYHPAIAEAHRRFMCGDIGTLINLRARYGHGGRPGYEKEWRGDRVLAGGGELTDQGVHVIDLIHWFAGVPRSASAYLQTAVWPLADLEDNAFALLRFDSGAVASFHTSWTQWKNLFSFEVFGDRGALVIEGLGGNYGTETLRVIRRQPEGGAPEVEVYRFGDERSSWRLEWDDFVTTLCGDGEMMGTAEDGVAAMRVLDVLYRSARTSAAVEV